MIDVPASASPHVARAITTARGLIAGATSANTRRSYATGWRQFTAHAQALGLEPLGAHPALVATFLGHLRERRGFGPDPGLAGGGDPVLSPRGGTGVTDRPAGGARSARGRPARRRRP